MIRFLTAGESHGKSLVVIIEGIPSNFKFDSDYINDFLKRRQSGYGRGNRMKIEQDRIEVLSGIRFGKTIGSPITYLIKNRDWENWKEIMSIEEPQDYPENISIPRPGHADLVGSIKYNFNDIRNSIERSSARESAASTAAGATASLLLTQLGIKVGSFVESIGGIYSDVNVYNNLCNSGEKEIAVEKITSLANQSELRVLSNKQELEIKEKIKIAKKNGDTLGGTVVGLAENVPAGLGSFMQYDKKLNSVLAKFIMSINAVKGMEIGAGLNYAESFGSEKHDEIILENNNLIRKSNNAGGIEGGISTGMPILLRAFMKPISTLMKPLSTINLENFEVFEARRERSDFTAVPAFSIIVEAMLSWVILSEVFIKFGNDNFEEIYSSIENYRKKIIKRLKENFRK